MPHRPFARTKAHTIKSLKDQLQGYPNNVEVFVLYDGGVLVQIQEIFVDNVDGKASLILNTDT